MVLLTFLGVVHYGSFTDFSRSSTLWFFQMTFLGVVHYGSFK